MPSWPSIDSSFVKNESAVRCICCTLDVARTCGDSVSSTKRSSWSSIRHVDGIRIWKWETSAVGSESIALTGRTHVLKQKQLVRSRCSVLEAVLPTGELITRYVHLPRLLLRGVLSLTKLVALDVRLASINVLSARSGLNKVPVLSVRDDNRFSDLRGKKSSSVSVENEIII